MRKTITGLLIAVLLGTVATPASAAEHPGCKGIDQAYSKASPTGRTALATVSQKFGCGTVTPDPVDAAACPSGLVTLGRYTYTGTLTGPIEHGYATWVGSWTLVAGGTDAWVETTWGSVDAGGFYWGERVPGSVKSVVIVSMTGEVETLGPINPVSQNHFENRTGINVVNLCG